MERQTKTYRTARQEEKYIGDLVEAVGEQQVEISGAQGMIDFGRDAIILIQNSVFQLISFLSILEIILYFTYLGKCPTQTTHHNFPLK